MISDPKHLDRIKDVTLSVYEKRKDDLVQQVNIRVRGAISDLHASNRNAKYSICL